MTHYLDAAIAAAREAGDLLRKKFREPMRVNAKEAHDIKLQIDVDTQNLITNLLLKKFPHHALYGEEGIVGDQTSEFQWVVDPLDGTVNYFYGIPHFCVSIALRCQGEIIVGVIYDPMREEMWTVQKGGEPKLNDRVFHVSDRTELSEAVISVGLSKNRRDDRIGSAAFAIDGASRAQVPADGQRRARYGLCGLRTFRRLHRTGNQPLGYSGGLDSRGDCGRHRRNETAH